MNQTQEGLYSKIAIRTLVIQSSFIKKITGIDLSINNTSLNKITQGTKKSYDIIESSSATPNTDQGFLKKDTILNQEKER